MNSIGPKDFLYLTTINEKSQPELIRYRWYIASQVLYLPELAHYSLLWHFVTADHKKLCHHHEGEGGEDSEANMGQKCSVIYTLY